MDIVGESDDRLDAEQLLPSLGRQEAVPGATESNNSSKKISQNGHDQISMMLSSSWGREHMLTPAGHEKLKEQMSVKAF